MDRQNEQNIPEPENSTEAVTFSSLIAEGKALLARHSRLLCGIAAGALLLLTLFVVIHFITGPAIAFFHSDCADSLLWAQAMVESGQVLTEDFSYAALLPFGSPVWMVPVLQIFGYTMTAQTVSMVIFAVIFVLAAYSLFRGMKWSAFASAGSTFLLTLLLSGSVKLREIMWQHVIYYSLGLLFLILLLNLYLRLLDCIRQLTGENPARKDRIRFALLSVALVLLCIGCGLDGMQILVLCVVPVAGSCIAVAFLNGNERFRSHAVLGNYLLAGIMGLGALLGLLILPLFTHGGKIVAAYEDGYSVWSPMDSWWGHIEGFLTAFVNLFGVNVFSEEPLFTLNSVFTVLQLASALIVLVCPVLLLLRYRKLHRTSARIFAWTHCILAVIMGLGYVCGALAAANWRLVPLLGSCILTTLVYLRELWDDRFFQRRIAVVLLAILLLTSLHHAGIIFKLPDNAGDNQKYITVTRQLAEKGYTKGYATFWHASAATLLSDGEVEVVTVEADQFGVRPRHYQTMKQWFDDEEGRQSYFLMLTQTEMQDISTSAYWAELSESRIQTDMFHCEGFIILVFSENPIS